MPRIAIIGAGSAIFARTLVRDTLSFPALEDSTIVLVDIDPEPLGYTETVARRMIEQGGYPARLEATTDRRKALEGADFVFVVILVGGRAPIHWEIDIPLKYGVDQCIADTMGPGGIFRAMRTAPALVEIARDMEELCPNALMLNHTNPMSMVCRAMRKATGTQVVGLCHSVQSAHTELAGIIGEDPAECASWVAGINHQAWVLSYTCRGEDAYPRIRKAGRENEGWRQGNTTRVEMLRQLDYYVTESSGHNSEYNPWFRKRPDLKEKYTPGGRWNGGTGFIKSMYTTDRAEYMGALRKIAESEEPFDLARGYEYGAYIMNALVTGEPFRFNATMPNDGLITNLPPGVSVEVPCYADGAGVHTCYVGDLPPQLAALNSMSTRSLEMAVDAALEGDRDRLYWAVAYDPLTAAVLSLEEIRAMVDEMFEREKEIMPQFAS
ncbi:MAG: alpha-galactosidase [Candidatus Brocadiia bacterium]|nr:alpha-galactosidase [Candidatus Brocadiia bacterium]